MPLLKDSYKRCRKKLNKRITLNKGENNFKALIIFFIAREDVGIAISLKLLHHNDSSLKPRVDEIALRASVQVSRACRVNRVKC